MTRDTNPVDKKQVRQAFSRAAADYDRTAVLQREIGMRMFERLDYIRSKPVRILDAGAGTGHFSAQLMKKYPDAEVISLDFALPMLHIASGRRHWWKRPRCVCADIEQLPIATESVDMVFSNVAIQWCQQLNRVFSEFLRVLRPGGLLMFSTFGPDTLKELRQAWYQADGGARQRTSEFIDMHDIGDELVRSRFADPVLDVEHFTLTYERVSALVRDLKALGARNAANDRPRGMTGRQRWQAMQQAYEQFRAEGRLPATYEVVYGHAWRPENMPLQQENGEVFVPIDRLRKS